MRKVFQILVAIGAGFAFYTAALIGYMSIPDIPMLPVILISLVPAIALLVGGMAITGFQGWKLYAGITLLSSAAFSLMVVGSLWLMFQDEVFIQTVGAEALEVFKGPELSFAIIVGYSLCGAALLMWGRADRSSTVPPPPPR